MTGSLDQIFTPDGLADQLVASARQGSPQFILDPAAGDGALLRAASRRWPSSALAALDLDPGQLRHLDVPTACKRGRCDFLSQQSRHASPIVRGWRDAIDVVLLNPPYSGRGYARWSATLDEVAVSSGRAMAFLVTAIDLVRSGGEVMALVPVSTLTSQRDADAWLAVKKIAQVEVIAEHSRGSFAGTARTVGLRITKSPTSQTRQHTLRVTRPSLEATIVRGAVPVHRAQSALLKSHRSRERVRYLHTTDLRSGAVVPGGRWLPGSHPNVMRLEPAVLLPRIGRPQIEKVCLAPSGDVVLSDCVYALRAGSNEGAEQLRARLEREFDQLAEAYGGACAPYLTISSLIETLAPMGVRATWNGPSRWALPAESWSTG